MKLPVLAALVMLSVPALHAQAPAGEAAPAVKVKIKNVKVTEQQTPMFNANNVREKRWRPKNWIEVDVEFEIDLPAKAGGRQGTYPALQLNVFLALQHMSEDNKREVIQGSLDLVNIPADGPVHALAYVSPSSLKLIFKKDNITVSSDIQGWGVEIIAEGQRVAGDSSVGKQPWWENTESFAMLQGMLLSKVQTPFAPLWGDYDVPVRPK